MDENFATLSALHRVGNTEIRQDTAACVGLSDLFFILISISALNFQSQFPIFLFAIFISDFYFQSLFPISISDQGRLAATLALRWKNTNTLTWTRLLEFRGSQSNQPRKKKKKKSAT